MPLNFKFSCRYPIFPHPLATDMRLEILLLTLLVDGRELNEHFLNEPATLVEL